ncbi:hypothetical protein ABZ069_38045 [Streptomyces microflavus]|uniref:hypothetical protein n=1 Tax=Streptomyces microflavus TaxID=1919 RepID=UPI0033B7CD99
MSGWNEQTRDYFISMASHYMHQTVYYLAQESDHLADNPTDAYRSFRFLVSETVVREIPEWRLREGKGADELRDCLRTFSKANEMGVLLYQLAGAEGLDMHVSQKTIEELQTLIDREFKSELSEWFPPQPAENQGSYGRKDRAEHLGHVFREDASRSDVQIEEARQADELPEPVHVHTAAMETDNALQEGQSQQNLSDYELRDLECEEIQVVPASSSKQPAKGRTRADAEVWESVDLSSPAVAESALADLRRLDAKQIRLRNKARYQTYKGQDGAEPIKFTVYGGGTDHPVLVFNGINVPEGAVATYEGSLRVSEKAGGIGAKAGRFFKFKGKEKLSSGTLAGTMTVTTEGTTPVDLAELTRLLKKSGITDKNLI